MAGRKLRSCTSSRSPCQPLSQRMKCWVLGWLCEGVIFFFRRATERAAEELEVHSGMLPRSYPLFKFALLDHHCRIHFNEARQLAVRARKHQPSVMGKPAPGAWQLAWQVEHGNFNPPSSGSQHLPLWQCGSLFHTWLTRIEHAPRTLKDLYVAKNQEKHQVLDANTWDEHLWVEAVLLGVGQISSVMKAFITNSLQFVMELPLKQFVIRNLIVHSCSRFAEVQKVFNSTWELKRKTKPLAHPELSGEFIDVEPHSPCWKRNELCGWQGAAVASRTAKWEAWSWRR